MIDIIKTIATIIFQEDLIEVFHIIITIINFMIISHIWRDFLVGATILTVVFQDSGVIIVQGIYHMLV